MSKMTVTADAKPMLNAYPDSVGGTLSDITGFLQKPELKDVFSSFYILPSVFNTDLDRGFSVIDYTLNEELFYFAGSDSDGRRQRTGEYCTEGSGRTGN